MTCLLGSTSRTTYPFIRYPGSTRHQTALERLVAVVDASPLLRSNGSHGESMILLQSTFAISKWKIRPRGCLQRDIAYTKIKIYGLMHTNTGLYILIQD